MTVKSDEIKAYAQKAEADPDILNRLFETMAGTSRRERQGAASVLAQVARDDSTLVAPRIADVLAALDLPEAQTRWEALDILTVLVDTDARTCEKALPEAENGLFDEDSGPLRLASMRFLCKFGATTEVRSQKVWPLIDEAIQCFHGDYEFPKMMLAVIDFSAGKIALNVKEELAARMKFDATNSKGGLKVRAQQILDNLK